MIRVIIIFLAVIIILTTIKNFLKKYRNLMTPKGDTKPETHISKNTMKGNDNIVDAKFEEIK